MKGREGWLAPAAPLEEPIGRGQATHPDLSLLPDLSSSQGSSIRRREFPLRRFCALSVSAVIGLCSCAVSAQRNDNQQSNKPAAEQEAAKPKTVVRKSAVTDPNKFALIVAGVGGEEAYKKKFTAQALRLREVLTGQLGFAEKNVYLLTEVAAAGAEDGARESDAVASKRATADEVRNAFAAIKSAANAESLVLVVMIGHGSFDNQQAKFNLVGPDLTAKDYAGLLGSLPGKRAVFVNCASSSGEFIKPLSAEGRIVITATRSGNEQNATVFAEHFIAGLTDFAADADKNGRVSLLEAFNYATKLTADWYKQKNRLATEHALIDDNGDGVGHEEATAGDGALAKTVYLDSKQLEEAGGDAELTKLINRRQQLEEAVEKLKAHKSEMKQEEYDAELERLLVELATVNQEIKKKQKK
jgi:hypothetical protein